MAITKQAKNIKIMAKKKDVMFAGKMELTAKQMEFDATEDNIIFSSTKKVQANGGS